MRERECRIQNEKESAAVIKVRDELLLYFLSAESRGKKKNNNTPAPFEASVLRLRALGSSLTLPSLNYVAITGRQCVCVMCVCRPSFHLPPAFVSRLLPASAMVMGPRRGASAVSPPPLIRSICSPRPPPSHHHHHHPPTRLRHHHQKTGAVCNKLGRRSPRRWLVSVCLQRSAVLIF